MRTSHFRYSGSAWRTNLGPDVRLPQISPEPDLPRTQAMALLTVRSGGPDSLFAKVLAYLRAVGSDEPDVVDYTRLREAGYITYKHIHRFHVVTPAGLHKAEMIARAMAKEFQIHHVRITPPGKRTNGPAIATCSCGGWSDHKSRRNIAALEGSAADHMAKVAAGEWKKMPRTVATVFDELFERRT